MQVKLTCSRVENYRSQRFGQVIEVDDEAGERMIAAGQARRIEAMTRCANENAAMLTRPPDRRRKSCRDS
jgi:hypothetical protein